MPRSKYCWVTPHSECRKTEATMSSCFRFSHVTSCECYADRHVWGWWALPSCAISLWLYAWLTFYFVVVENEMAPCDRRRSIVWPEQSRTCCCNCRGVDRTTAPTTTSSRTTTTSSNARLSYSASSSSSRRRYRSPSCVACFTATVTWPKSAHDVIAASKDVFHGHG